MAMRGAALVLAVLSTAAQAQEAPFRQWWDMEYTVREGELVDYRERREVLIGAQSQVQAMGQQRLSVNEHFFDLEILEAATLKADGRRIDVAPDRVMTQAAAPGPFAIYEADVKLKTVVFPDVAVGDRLLLVSRWRQKRAQLPGGFWRAAQFSPSGRYAAARVVVDVPRGTKLHTFAEGLEHAHETRGERTRHTWTYSERPYWREEPNNVLPLDRAPRVLVSSFSDWRSAGLAYWSRAEPKTVPTAQIAALADEITRDTSDRRAQARAIYEWVANNIRYVAVALGNGGWVPHAAPAVLEHRYGDCKDKATLMRALLTAKGIESEHALINNRALYRQYDVPAPGFDHVIVYLPEFDLYADPTSRYAAFGVLPRGLYDKPVLRTGAKGVTVARTPAATPEANRALLRAELTLEDDGSAKGQSVLETTGFLASLLRSRVMELESQDPAEFGRRLMSEQGLAGSALLEARSARERTEPYAVKASFAITDRPFAPGSSTAIAAGPRLILYPLDMRTVVREGRRYDFACAPAVHGEELSLRLPEGRRVAFMPPDVNERHELGDYRATYVSDGRVVTVRRELVLRTPGGACTVAMANALKTVLDAADLDLRRVLRFATPQPGP